MNYQFSYLIGCLTILIFWMLLFFFRKDSRKEMLLISFLFGISGFFVDPIYSNDWWSPLTITNTIPGIESFLFGFGVAGVASVIYIEFFNKKLKYKKNYNKESGKKDFNFLIICLLMAGLFFVSYFILGLNSYYASFPAYLIPLLIIYIKRKDLIVNSLVSGILLMIVSTIFYIIPELITPGWINATWNFALISGITILKIPIEDLIWFFMSGLIIGPLYEYWKEAKIVDND